MVEPVTTGALVAGALAAGAGALAKGFLGEMAKDAYQKLKTMLAPAAATDVDRIEKKPESVAHATVLAEAVDELPEAERASLRALADALRAALAAEGHGATVDNRITVIATHGGMAAGRDQYIGVPPQPQQG
jgi:hypothetical protein